MKKILLSLFTLLFFISCGSSRLSDVRSLQVGMDRMEVDYIMDSPIRILSSEYDRGNLIEVYEYVSYRDESYAIEFHNDLLVGYTFMYANVTPIMRPPHHTRPPRPNWSNNNRPGNGNNRPNRPGGNGRPIGTTRPETGEIPVMPSRPSERPQPSNGNTRDVTRTPEVKENK